MPKTTPYAVPASGTWVSIPATIFSRAVQIIEDASLTPQGLQYKLPDDGFVNVYQLAPSTEPIMLGNPVAAGNNQGVLIGWPAQTGLNTSAATTLIKLTSATATATKVRVTEIE